MQEKAPRDASEMHADESCPAARVPVAAKDVGDATEPERSIPTSNHRSDSRTLASDPAQLQRYPDEEDHDQCQMRHLHDRIIERAQ